MAVALIVVGPLCLGTHTHNMNKTKEIMCTSISAAQTQKRTKKKTNYKHSLLFT